MISKSTLYIKIYLKFTRRELEMIKLIRDDMEILRSDNIVNIIIYNEFMRRFSKNKDIMRKLIEKYGEK